MVISFFITLASQNSLILALAIITLFWASYFLQKANFVFILLILEMLIITNIFFVFSFIPNVGGAFYLTFITVSVCEAILGLALLIFLARHKGPEIAGIN